MNTFTRLHINPHVGRSGIVHTRNGDVFTPVFMPVGTNGSVKALSYEDIEKTGAQIILANNYHLYLRPGSQNIHDLGGIHKFMHWSRPILTDSGGFQVWSLGKTKAGYIKINPDGIKFKSHIDGSLHHWTPEDAIESQLLIGSDIIMPLDICTSDDATYQEAKEALKVTEEWLIRCKEYLLRRCQELGITPPLLFGIAQGAKFKDLRRKAVEFILSNDLDGLSLGGESIGFNMNATEDILGYLSDLLPANKPVYTMGLGLNPSDIQKAVKGGADMFDCVAPTRLARNGSLYQIGTDDRINIASGKYKLSDEPLDPNCNCDTCNNYSKSYLHHLFKCQEILYYRLATIHNVSVMVKTADDIRRNQIPTTT